MLDSNLTLLFLEGGFLKKLLEEVKYLNSLYCLKTKNRLVIRKYYDHYQVCLTGKTKDTGLKNRYFGITNGFSNPVLTLGNLKECYETGWLKAVIKRYENRT